MTMKLTDGINLHVIVYNNTGCIKIFKENYASLVSAKSVLSRTIPPNYYIILFSFDTDKISLRVPQIFHRQLKFKWYEIGNSEEFLKISKMLEELIEQDNITQRGE